MKWPLIEEFTVKVWSIDDFSDRSINYYLARRDSQIRMRCKAYLEVYRVDSVFPGYGF